MLIYIFNKCILHARGYKVGEGRTLSDSGNTKNKVTFKYGNEVCESELIIDIIRVIREDILHPKCGFGF